MQRAVFRVERMFGDRADAHAADGKLRPAQSAAQADASVQALKRELTALREAVAHNRRELGVLIGDGRERHMAHAAGKLGAAIEGMEKATVKILKSAEAIDDSAKALAASFKSDYEHGLAQEIQEHVVAIYEACNFQDLSGQRIGHVIETLNRIEDQVERMLGRTGGPPRPIAPPRADALLNGPCLDGDSGHTSQGDIDALFD